VRHQRVADAVLLARRIDRDGADHRQRGALAIVAGEDHRPALDRADQRLAVERSEAERGDRHGALAHGISGAAVAIGSERAIEQLLDRVGIDLGEGNEVQHGILSRESRALPGGRQRRRALASSPPNASGMGRSAP